MDGPSRGVPRDARSARSASLHATGLRPLFGVLLLLLAALACVRCGPSPEQVAVADYKSAVTPLLEREKTLYVQLNDLAADRVDELNTYQDWVQNEGIPAYRALLDEARALAPPDDSPAGDLPRLHRDLVRWFELVLEFLEHEKANRAVYDEVRNSAGFEEYTQAFEAARQAIDAYQLWTEDPDYPGRTKDNRYTRLIEAQRHLERIESELLAQRMDLDEAKARFRDRVAAPVREMKRTRFLDDEGSRLLATAVSAADLLYATYDPILPLRYRSLDAIRRARDAIEASERIRKRYTQQLRSLAQTR